MGLEATAPPPPELFKKQGVSFRHQEISSYTTSYDTNRSLHTPCNCDINDTTQVWVLGNLWVLASKNTKSRHTVRYWLEKRYHSYACKVFIGIALMEERGGGGLWQSCCIFYYQEVSSYNKLLDAASYHNKQRYICEQGVAFTKAFPQSLGCW